MTNQQAEASAFLYRIRGCLEKCLIDDNGASKQIREAKEELRNDIFLSLIDDVFEYVLESSSKSNALSQDDVSRYQKILSLVKLYDSNGDEKRQVGFKAHIETIRNNREKKTLDELEKEEERKKIELESLQAEEDRKKREGLRLGAVRELKDCFQDDFPFSEALYKEKLSRILEPNEYQSERTKFVKDWFIESKLSKFIPDQEQASAIAAINGNILVTARAGSGKTSTLVNRAIFLHKHCNVATSEMLLLAFNKKAAQEIHRRIMVAVDKRAEAQIRQQIEIRKGKSSKKDKLQIEEDAIYAVAQDLNIEVPHVMTFHALAYAIVHPEKEILFDAPKPVKKLTYEFQSIINECIQGSFKNEIRAIMLEHFRDDWEQVVSGGFDKGKEELLQYRRAKKNVSMKGEFVKSFGEKAIADFLFEHDVPYKYERNHWWDEINYKPDFTIITSKNPESGVIIEYFGLAGDVEYDEQVGTKQKYWKEKCGWALLSIFPDDIMRGNLQEFRGWLKDRLEKLGVTCSLLSEEEIWRRIQQRAHYRFTNICTSFISKCRKACIDPDGLNQRIEAYSPLNNAERGFLSIVPVIYSKYLERLKTTGKDDFDGLLHQASLKINSGTTRFDRKSGQGDIRKLQYIFIDEFQDFSELFFRLVASFRNLNPSIEFFCVGDDWQAINGFAGSDLKFFREFDSYFGASQHLSISTNYRSCSSVVNAGNQLMRDFGMPARVDYEKPGGQVLICDIGQNSFKLNSFELERHSGDSITPAVLRIIRRAALDNQSVILLTRTNEIRPWYVHYLDEENDAYEAEEGRYLNLIKSFLPDYAKHIIGISTVHKYKGLEKQVVILIDAVDRCYPLLHPDWIFTSILGDSEEKITNDDRRLFYVALTRAKEKVVLITERGSESPFLSDLKSSPVVQNLDWSKYPSFKEAGNKGMIRVKNSSFKSAPGTFAIRDKLKKCSFKWKPKSKCWERLINLEEDQNNLIEKIKQESWVKRADGIEVEILDGSERQIGQFRVTKGGWTKIGIDSTGKAIAGIHAD